MLFGADYSALKDGVNRFTFHLCQAIVFWVAFNPALKDGANIALCASFLLDASVLTDDIIVSLTIVFTCLASLFR